MKPFTGLWVFNKCKGKDLETTTMNDAYFFSDPKAMELPNDKEMWIKTYAVRILIRFRQGQTPLGAANIYLTRLKKDLEVFYDDPVRRLSIEASY